MATVTDEIVIEETSPVEDLEPIPVGPLGLVALKGEDAFVKKVDSYLQKWRKERDQIQKDHLLYSGYEQDTFVVKSDTPRFGSGEGKGVFAESVRGRDLYYICDVTNSSIEYKVNGVVNRYSPDDHFSDLKRLIGATSGRAKRITVFLPYLYEGRMNARSGSESLDCAQMLQELDSMGVAQVITFDAHEPRVQNAIPLGAFENVSPVYQNIKALLKAVDDLEIDSDHMMVISPDEGGMPRAIYFANMLGLDMGMFYRRKDYTRVVNGTHPIAAYEFLGSDLSGKDVIIVDDMISSGDTMIEVARLVKKRGARRVFCFGTFGLFTGGLKKFDDAVWAGTIDKVFTTDLIYQRPELLEKPWHVDVPMAKYVALLIDTLNHDLSIGPLLEPAAKINTRVKKYKRDLKKRKEALAEAGKA